MSRANQASVAGLSIENCPRLWLATSEEPGRTIPHAVLLLDAAALLVRKSPGQIAHEVLTFYTNGAKD
jgi:hypothetical protein